MQHENKRAIREILRQRGASAVDQEFIINLFDSVLETIDVDGKFPSEDMIRIREEISAKLLSNQHLLIVLRQQTAELDTLRRLSLHFSSSLNLSTILNTVVSDAVELVENPRTAHIFLYDEEKDLLQFGAARDEEGPKEKSYSEPRKNGLTYKVARTGKPIIIPDMRNHPIYEGAPKEWQGSILGIPLKVEDSVVGVMSISRSTTGEFSKPDLRLLELLAEQAAISISNARIHAMVSKQAKSDTLTGLPNRRALDERLAVCRRASRDGESGDKLLRWLENLRNPITKTYSSRPSFWKKLCHPI
ncbi:MAG: GAF domain-containing protein, partial [Anaerolineales bacterium]|nr:GAF domain-containing protein [Anaerolineales bacterium]